MVEPAIGYLLKTTQALLRLRMEESLRPLGLTVSHYSTLFRLQGEPGISASELARATFMTRQSMNEMLQTLIDRGLVERAAAARGRVLPVTLTTSGLAALADAQTAVDAIERRMLSALTGAQTDALAVSLAACGTALEQPAGDEGQ